MKKTAKCIGLFVCLIGGCMVHVSKAQDHVVLSHYGKHKVWVNQSLGLLSSSGEVSFIARKQWVGMEGAPQIFWGSAHTRIEKIGGNLGLTVRHESLGVEKYTEFDASFAKAIRLSERSYLGMSLNAGLAKHRADLSRLDAQDPAFSEDLNQTYPLLGVGLSLYDAERYYVGVSLPRMWLNARGEGELESQTWGHQFHFTGGVLLPMGEQFHLRPSVLVSYTRNLPVQLEASAMVFMNKMFGIGLNLKNNADVGALMHINYKKFGVGYGYQFNASSGTSGTKRINNSTHEVGLTYRFSEWFSLL